MNIYQHLNFTEGLKWLTLTSLPSPKLSQVPELEKEVLDSKVVHWRQCQVQKPLQLGGERIVGRTCNSPPPKKKHCDLWNPQLIRTTNRTLDVQPLGTISGFPQNLFPYVFSGKIGQYLPPQHQARPRLRHVGGSHVDLGRGLFGPGRWVPRGYLVGTSWRVDSSSMFSDTAGFRGV